ncbi:hypothetical protein [Ensifer sp. SL37]|uniref:hypothetical protein n=1 Tax=Ensifer sp. SL37 TaxID=2995137 RepID=UPI002275EB10|nr:hypothetical protein [Ensifer sp. SL37]MCY1740836.1 hypothetical protein [Ensifer sp. SL37]
MKIEDGELTKGRKAPRHPARYIGTRSAADEGSCFCRQSASNRPPVGLLACVKAAPPLSNGTNARTLGKESRNATEMLF